MEDPETPGAPLPQSVSDEIAQTLSAKPSVEEERERHPGGGGGGPSNEQAGDDDEQWQLELAIAQSMEANEQPVAAAPVPTKAALGVDEIRKRRLAYLEQRAPSGKGDEKT